MEARNMPSFGEPMLIREMIMIVPSQWIDKSISVTGRLDEHNVSRCEARLVDPKSRTHLVIDTTLVEPFDARTGSLFQFIGEMKASDNDHKNPVVLQARVVRCCDGLDLVLYEQALKGQREYLSLKQNRHMDTS